MPDEKTFLLKQEMGSFQIQMVSLHTEAICGKTSCGKKMGKNGKIMKKGFAI